MLRWWLLLTLVAATGRCIGAGEDALPAFARVDVAPTSTSIYLGTVAMSMPPFTREGQGYQSRYVAKVFPFFFYNETGTMRVELPDEALRKLAGGQPIDFTGLARRADGAERRVAGRATPNDAVSGKLKVRVFYSKRIELIFNTTYRFRESLAPAAEARETAPGQNQ